MPIGLKHALGVPGAMARSKPAADAPRRVLPTAKAVGAAARRTAELPSKVLAAMNAQLRAELVSWYEYLAMAAWLDQASFPGAAAWMRAQAAEEMAHAMRFYDFILDRNGKVDLQDLPKPRASYRSILEVFEAGFAHEQDVTSALIGLHELSVEERDYVSHAFLQGFLMEQVEEERSASLIVDKLRMAGKDVGALLGIDRELGARQVGMEGKP